MNTRRNLLIGTACIGAAGLSYVLTPRERLSLLGKAKMDAIVPVTFNGYSAEANQGFVRPKTEGLAAELYSEIVERSYRGETNGADVMLLIAYGGVQSDLLQLHRPEVCYPALGFSVRSKTIDALPLPGGVSLPIVRMVAVAGDRHENVVYWTRVGEAIPTSNTEQRTVLLETSFKGVIPDGVLVRTSVINADAEAGFRTLDDFIPRMLSAMSVTDRKALIGTRAAKTMQV